MSTENPDVVDGSSRANPRTTQQLDTTLDLLSNQRRRYVLYYLRERGSAVTVEELARQISVWERGPADADRVRMDLHHSHLPRLDDAGVVAFDREGGHVSLADVEETIVTEYLDLAADEDRVV